MTNVSKALYKFFSQFGLPAYVENNVPANAQLPYITYTQTANNWRDTGSIQMRVWQQSTSFVGVNNVIDTVIDTVGEGVSIPTGNGCVVMYPSNPYIQSQPSDDPSLKILYVNFEIQCLTN